MSNRPTIGRRRFIGAAGAMAAAASVDAWIGAPDIAEAATRVPVTLTAGSGNGVANRTALVNAVNAAQPGDILELPAGTFEVDISSGSISLPRSIDIVGAVRYQCPSNMPVVAPPNTAADDHKESR